MKKVLIALSVLGLFALGSCAVEECDCIFEDPATCINSYELAYGCSNDCDWDYIDDCDYDCVNDGYISGACVMDDIYGDACECYY